MPDDKLLQEDGFYILLETAAISFAISGSEKRRSVQYDSFKIENNLTHQIDRCKFTVRSTPDRTYRPRFGNEVIIQYGGVRIFAGIITRVTNKPVAYGMTDWQIECSDYTRILDSRLVAATYQDMTVNAIIADIVANFTPGGFTTAQVNCTANVSYIKFNYLPVSDCLTKLAEMTGFDWYVDYNKDIWFDVPSPTSAPVDVEDDNGSHEYESLILREDGSQMRNTIYVRGGEYLGATFSSSFRMDGQQTEVLLPYRFDDFACSLTGHKLKTGVDPIDSFDNYDALYNYSEKIVRLPKPPSQDAMFSFSGKPYYPVRTKVRDQAAIDATLSAEGQGDGVYESLIIERNINSRDGALQRARAEINTYKNTIVEGEFMTLTPGFKAGQKVRINSVTRAIDEYYIVNKVETYCLSPDVFKYRVSLVTTKTFGFIELLRRLIKKETEQIEISDDETVDFMEAVDETLELSDVATPKFNDVAIAEDMGLDDGTASANLDYAVQWVYGAYVPTGFKRVFILNGSFLA
jgi:hypothetical protein